jgi:hypothetical protein
MTFEYCETCQRITNGGYFASATKSIKAYLCSRCSAITYIDNESDPVSDEAWENDFRLRNEANKLQLQYYKALNKNKNIRSRKTWL